MDKYDALAVTVQMATMQVASKDETRIIATALRESAANAYEDAANTAESYYDVGMGMTIMREIRAILSSKARSLRASSAPSKGVKL